MKMVCTGCGLSLSDVERRQREDRARHDRARDAADAGDDDVLEQRRAPPVDAREADGEDRDRDRRLHHLPDLQAGVGRGHGEDDAEEQAPQRPSATSTPAAPARAGTIGGYVSPACERQVGVLGQRLRLGSVHP